MTIAEILLAQLGRETAATRKVLERVPEGTPEWKPHPKSMELGYLSFLVAAMFGWIASIVESEYLDLATGGAPPQLDSEARLAFFDKSVAAATQALSNTSDEHLMNRGNCE